MKGERFKAKGKITLARKWVNAIAETHHNQSPMRWVSLRALQVALLYPSCVLNDHRLIAHTRCGDQSKTTQYPDRLRWQQLGSEYQFEQTKTFQLS